MNDKINLLETKQNEITKSYELNRNKTKKDLLELKE